MLALLTTALALPVHQMCGGIPGGMYDGVERRSQTLSVTMHRYIADDASTQFLDLRFLASDGSLVETWDGDPSTAKYDKASGTWSTRARVRMPDETAWIEVIDTHHERLCTVQVLSDGQVAVIRIQNRSTRAAASRRDGPTFSDETLEGEAVDVARGDKSAVESREIDDAPDNPERRARMLAMLKQQLPRMEAPQVLEWMEHQGFDPDDADVFETLGADWRSRARPPKK